MPCQRNRTAAACPARPLPAELVAERPEVPEYTLQDGTVRCPRIRILVEAGPAGGAGRQELRTVTWRLAGREANHVLVFLTVSPRVPGHPTGCSWPCAEQAWIYNR